MNNQTKALYLLRLPDELGAVDGQIQKKTSSRLVETRTDDFTKMVKNPTTGRFEPTTTYAYSAESKTELFGAYAFNLLANYVHAYGYDPNGWNDDVYSLSRGTEQKPLSAGPLAGVMAWFGWGVMKCVKMKNGYDLVRTGCPFNNTIMSGPNMGNPTDITDPPITIKRYNKVITKTKTTVGAVTYPSYTRSKLMERSGLTEEQIASYFSETFHMIETSDSTHIHSYGCDIETVGDKVKLVFYVNGLKAKEEINPSGMMTSYLKTWPGVSVQWRLYDQIIVNTSLGSSAVMAYQLGDDNTLTVVSGGESKIENGVVTWNPQDGGWLVGWIEEQPAHGKNFQVSSRLDLETMIDIME